MSGAASLADIVRRAAAGAVPPPDAGEARSYDTLRTREQRLAALRLPLTARDERLLTEDTLATTPVLEAVSAWASDQTARPWIVLCGPPGRGKTLAAAWWLLRGTGRYVGARELERLRMAAFGQELERYERLLDTAGLVVDDLGREEQAGRFEQALLDLVDYRRRRGMRTIAIANLTRQQLQARYPDARLWSRLEECATFVADRGSDLRRSAAGG